MLDDFAGAAVFLSVCGEANSWFQITKSCFLSTTELIDSIKFWSVDQKRLRFWMLTLRFAENQKLITIKYPVSFVEVWGHMMPQQLW